MATLQTPARRYETQSTGELLSGVVNDTRDLVAAELDAAKLEMQRGIADTKAAVVNAAIGGAVAGIGALVLAIAIAQLIALALPSWLSYAIVGIALCAVSAVLLARGRGKARHAELKPKAAIQDAKGDVQWLKREATSAAK